jgi:hypothetical protein
MYRPLLLPAAAALALSACSAQLDWREFQPEGSGLVAAFPCKPDRHVRSVKLAVQPVRMVMLVCSAQEMSFAVSFIDLAEPAKISEALAELQALAASNLAAQRSERFPLAVPGMTPNDKAARLRLEGRQPDGTAMEEQAAFFVKGLRVYQATVLGRRVTADAADTFIGGLRLAS